MRRSQGTTQRQLVGARTLWPLVVLGWLAAIPIASAQSWVPWANTSNGLVSGTFPVLAISAQGDIFYSFAMPAQGAMGRVWRAKLSDPARAFTLMPGFPLPPPASGSNYTNVETLVVNQNGEPIVGFYATASSSNTSPMLMTWDEAAGQWFAPPLNPSSSTCAHRIANMTVSANGDIWATCQWHGAYLSKDQGRTFDYVDVDALMKVQHPEYFPTRASNNDYLGAIYGVTTAPDNTVYFGTETGGVMYSSDRGATWTPLDQDDTNLMSSMARASNVGNVAGVGVMPDGRILMQGAPGYAAYPASDGYDLWLVDPVKKTVTTSFSFPPYYLGGQNVTHFVVLPSGELFFHTGHNTVDQTGAPALGGIVRSTDGLNWSAVNTGISEVSFVTAANQWVDGNGRGNTNPFAVSGNDLYTSTTRGEIFIYSNGGSASTDAGYAADAGSAVDAGDMADAGEVIDAGYLPSVDGGPELIDAGSGAVADAGGSTPDAGQVGSADASMPTPTKGAGCSSVNGGACSALLALALVIIVTGTRSRRRRAVSAPMSLPH